MKSIVEIFENLMGLVGVGGFLLIVFSFGICVCREALNIRYKLIMTREHKRRYIMRRVVLNSIGRLLVGTAVAFLEYKAYMYIFYKIYDCINVESVNLTVALAGFAGLVITTIMTFVVMAGTVRRMAVYNKIYDRAYKNTEGKVESMWI